MEKKRIVYEFPEGKIAIMDSISYITEEERGQVVVCGSHGGLPAAEYAIKYGVKGAIFNDAGRGKEDAGIAGLRLLDEHGIMGATVDTMTARIGDGMDSYESGIISYVNKNAEKAGVKVGMKAKEAAMLMLRNKP